MIQVIAGEKGSGKTKKMISLANDFVSQSKGHVIYIGNNSEVMYDLNSSIRLIDLSKIPLSSVDSFIGFIYGIISEDYDIECAYIDNLNSIVKNDDATVELFAAVKKISDEYNVKFVLGVKSPKDKLLDIEIEYIAV